MDFSELSCETVARAIIKIVKGAHRSKSSGFWECPCNPTLVDSKKGEMDLEIELTYHPGRLTRKRPRWGGYVRVYELEGLIGIILSVSNEEEPARNIVQSLVKGYKDFVMLYNTNSSGCPMKLIDMVNENMDDAVRWGVLADWCEEHGNTLLSEWLRKRRPSEY